MSIRSDIGMVQFENANSLRMFPFASGSSLKSRDGKELPENVIVDVHMVVPAGFGNPKVGMADTELPDVRLTGVHLSKSMISVCFVSECGGTRQALSAMVSASEFRPYSPVRLEKLCGSEDIGGVVTFGDVILPDSPEIYTLDSARIHPCCIVAGRQVPVRRFVDPRSGDSVSGDAEIEFSGYVESTADGHSFSLSLTNGSETELMSECDRTDGTGSCGATPISSINGIAPDANGNIVFWFH